MTSIQRCRTIAWIGLALPFFTTCTNRSGDPPAPLAKLESAIAAREYRASRSAEGLQAPNRAHNLRSYFEPTGVRVVDRTALGSPELVSLSLVALGRGAHRDPVPPGALSHDGARVEIARDLVTEWYENSPAGLEQGFTLAARPPGSGPLVLELGVAQARARARGDAVLLESHAGRKLSYAKLAVADANGARIAAHFEVPDAERVRLVVDDRRAAYPLAIDPLLTQLADTQLVSDAPSTLFGYTVASAGDVDGNGHDDVIVGAYEYDAGASNAGAAFVFRGSANGVASGTSADPEVQQLETNQAGAALGTSVAGAGDVDGDGYGDVIVGAPGFDAGEPEEGAAFVFLGSENGLVELNPARLESDEPGAAFGYSVAGAGDVDGNGYDDVIVGAVQHDRDFSGDLVPDAGAAYIFAGSASGIASGNIASAAAGFSGNQTNMNFGFAVASAGDVDGNGYDDVIVTARHFRNIEINEGGAFIFLGSATGVANADITTADTRLETDDVDAEIVSAAGAGDVDRDGYGDVIVGSPFYLDAGAAFVVYGSATGIPNGSLSAPAVTSLASDQANSAFGVDVAGAGDVNSDGYADVIVGASRYEDPDSAEGAAFVYLGGPSGIANGGPSNAFARLQADEPNAFFGYSVAGAGDVNGDGFADVIVGAPYFGANDEGAAFVYHGGPWLPEVGVSNSAKQASDQPKYRWLSSPSPTFYAECQTPNCQAAPNYAMDYGVCRIAVPSHSSCLGLGLDPNCITVGYDFAAPPPTPPSSGFECCAWQGKCELTCATNSCANPGVCPQHCDGNGTPDGPLDYCVNATLDCGANQAACNAEETRLRNAGVPDCCFLSGRVEMFRWGTHAGEAPIYSDTDAYPDQCDNCSAAANDSQSDADGDRRGDTCDSIPGDSHHCSDVDGDHCDDCSSGTFDPANDHTPCLPEPDEVLGLAAGATLLTLLARRTRRRIA